MSLTLRFGFLVVLLSLGAAVPARPDTPEAGPAHLVADLNPGSVGWNPHETAVFQFFTRLGDRTVFLGFLTGDLQCGLWSTDGTAAGTVRLADLCAASLNPLAERAGVQVLGAAGSLAFLADSSGVLWRTDGTAAGTYPLGVVASQPVAGPGNIFYFISCPTAQACSLWRSDGSVAGTLPVREIPGLSPSLSVRYFVQGGRMLFSVDGSPAGSVLWATDGTAGGTRVLAHFARRIGSVLAVGSSLYVSTGDGASELWLLSAAGIRPLRIGRFPLDVQLAGVRLFQTGGRLLIESYEGEGVASLWEIAGANRVRFLDRFGSGMGPVAEVGGRLLFAAGASRNSGSYSLWTLRLQAGSRPRLLRGCPAGCPGIDAASPRLGVLGGRAVLAGRDTRGSELWETDGTGPGTRLLKDLCPGPCDGLPRSFSPAQGRLLFTAGDRDLWVTDGSEGGTARLGRIVSGASDAEDRLDFAELGSGVVFSGLDDVAGPQPWASDLTAAGTRRLLRLGGGLAAGASIQTLTPSGSGALFGACSAAGASGLWHSDGTAAGTERLVDAGLACDSFATGPIVTAGSTTFFSLGDAARLWRTDGTPAGTQVVASWDDAILQGYLPLNGSLLAVLSPPPTRPRPWIWDFWRSDGTSQGTVRTGSLALGGDFYFAGPAAGGGALFVAVRGDELGTFLWRTDGTSAGTFALIDQLVPPEPFPGDFVLLGGRPLLLMESGERSQAVRELWTSDGTAAGTVPVIADLNAPRPVNPRQLADFQGVAYFFADSGEPGRPLSLWRSDGTEAGTSRVAVLPAPRDLSAFFPLSLTAAGDFLYFPFDDGVHGEELWRTDGTAAGTVMVKDIAPGPAHSRAGSLTAAAGRLYFTATDGEHGLELWTSDGTAEGTRMVQDILPGPVSSWPQSLVAADGNLFFTADDGEHGRELWVLPVEP